MSGGAEQALLIGEQAADASGHAYGAAEHEAALAVPEDEVA